MLWVLAAAENSITEPAALVLSEGVTYRRRGETRCV